MPTKKRSIRAVVEEPLGLILLDRAGKANAYDTRMLEELEAALARLLGADEVRAIVVASAVPSRFCAGADLDEIATRRAADALELRSLRVFDALAASPKPTVAAIDGPAVGGGLELALACDARVASTRARFWLPETSFGLLPAAGGTFRLPRVLGDALAREVILFGRRLSAEEALAYGLVGRLVEPELLGESARALAALAAARDPFAQRLAKEALAAASPDEPGERAGRLVQALLYERSAAKPRPRPR
jgi:enoyl-CoA hydratase